MVKYPSLRNTLIQVLSYLADEEHQRDLWVRESRPFDPVNDFLCDIDELVLVLEDMGIFDHIDRTECTLLKNKAEVEAVRAVAEALDRCIDALHDASNREYIEHPRWADVVSSARAAHEILTA